LLAGGRGRYTEKVTVNGEDCFGSLRESACGYRCASTKEAVFSSSEDLIRASQVNGKASGNFVAPRRTYAWAGRAVESLFAVLFPSDCRICCEPLLQIARLPVCQACLDNIVPVHGRLCSVCGERVLSPYAADSSTEALVCPVCQRVQPPFASAVAYGSYEGGLRELVHLLKYSGVRPAANVLGRMLADSLLPLLSESKFSDNVVVIPVPLHSSRRRQRGFNQAELIAAAALKCIDAPGHFQLTRDVLYRERDTHSQIGLTSHQRRENLRGAFVVRRASEIAGKEILLVDDVFTTGTTVSECARVLRRAGAAQVRVATAARTLKLASQYAEMKRPMGTEQMGEPEALRRAVGS
jgi:ComF family protein